MHWRSKREASGKPCTWQQEGAVGTHDIGVRLAQCGKRVASATARCGARGKQAGSRASGCGWHS